MPPAPLDLTHHSNGSEYTLGTVHYRDEDDAVVTPTTPLMIVPGATYGATQPRSESHSTPANSKKLIFNAVLKMSVIFIVSTIVLGGTLYLALPTLEE